MIIRRSSGIVRFSSLPISLRKPHKTPASMSTVACSAQRQHHRGRGSFAPLSGRQKAHRWVCHRCPWPLRVALKHAVTGPWVGSSARRQLPRAWRMWDRHIRDRGGVGVKDQYHLAGTLAHHVLHPATVSDQLKTVAWLGHDCGLPCLTCNAHPRQLLADYAT